jgi:hypothetical protein
VSLLHQRLINWWVAKQREHQRIAASRRAFIRTIIVGGVVAPFAPDLIERVTQPRWRSNADLLRAMGAGDTAAMEAFAAFISAPILQVIEQAPVIGSLFVGHGLGEITPVIPLVYHWDDGTPPDPSTPSLVEAHNTWCHGRFGGNSNRVADCA